MGSSKGGASNTQIEASQSKLADQLTSLYSQQEGQSSQLFNLAFPGMQQSENFYSALASGSPDLISKVIAPAAQQLQQQSAGAKQQIMSSAPAGGEKNLALEQVNVNQGAQLGALASQGYTGSFNALAEMGGRGVGLSQSGAQTAISAANSANSTYSNLWQEHTQDKGATMSMFGGLGSSAMSGIGAGLGAAAGGSGGMASLAAGLMAF
jgi:hypothetical protein